MSSSSQAPVESRPDCLPPSTYDVTLAGKNNKRTAEKSPEGLDYQWSMVCGPDRSYLWILSRTPTMAPETWKMLTDKARSLGFECFASHSAAAAGPSPSRK